MTHVQQRNHTVFTIILHAPPTLSLETPCKLEKGSSDDKDKIRLAGSAERERLESLQEEVYCSDFVRRRPLISGPPLRLLTIDRR